MISALENIEKLNYILPTDYLMDGKKVLSKGIAVIIHMHYSDTLDNYKKYIDLEFGK